MPTRILARTATVQGFMDALIGLVGVALGAMIAPVLELMHRRSTSRTARRQELLELVSSYLARSGDQLVVESESDLDAQWRSQIGLEANSLRWRIQLLAPPKIAKAAESYAAATETLRKRLQVAGGWHGDQIADEWDTWQRHTRELIEAAHSELGS